MSSRSEIEARVREVFQKTLKVDPEKLRSESVLKDDLQLDSLDMIEVVYELEDAFDVQIPEENVKEIRTFAEVVEGLAAALDARKDDR